jgi:hypothetical protein
MTNNLSLASKYEQIEDKLEHVPTLEPLEKVRILTHEVERISLLSLTTSSSWSMIASTWIIVIHF